ncbi:unnamed protein product [Albugo candida]|uniref:Uncharacterized protein n=1 Tax=Albugo candida TaxID=65357 RepID=A0A024GFE2_9STRA|nr:unnamed protein product [Albugo candida]|eukprot:CCI45466.1 unnamed protein product [Albugo candida]
MYFCDIFHCVILTQYRSYQYSIDVTLDTCDILAGREDLAILLLHYYCAGKLARNIQFCNLYRNMREFHKTSVDCSIMYPSNRDHRTTLLVGNATRYQKHSINLHATIRRHF